MTQQPYPQQQEPGAYAYGYPPPPFPEQQRPKGSGLGISALVLGIIALLLSWIPVVNYLAIVLALVGLGLGIAGIIKSHRVMSIIGSALSVLAIVVAIIINIAFVAAVDEAVAELDSSLPADTSIAEGGDAVLDAEADANAGADAGAGAGAENERGNVVQAIGEQGGLTDDSGADFLTFSVDAITVDPVCTADWAAYGTPVDPGRHLVAVQMTVATSPAVSEEDYLSLSGYDFTFIGADGVTVDALDSMATYGCLEDSQTFTSDQLGPGQTYVGAIVLDVPAAGGTLVLDPSWGQLGGWEYSF